MGIRVETMILIVVMISVSTVLAEHSVLLNNGFQKLTSSTLKWLPHNDPGSLRDAVVGSVEYVPIGKLVLTLLNKFFSSTIFLA